MLVQCSHPVKQVRLFPLHMLCTRSNLAGNIFRGRTVRTSLCLARQRLDCKFQTGKANRPETLHSNRSPGNKLCTCWEMLHRLLTQMFRHCTGGIENGPRTRTFLAGIEGTGILVRSSL